MSDLLYEVAKAEKPFASREEIVDEARKTQEYLSEFDSSYDVWDAVDSRGHEDGSFKLSDIYNGNKLDCQGRATAVALHDDMYDSDVEVDMLLQYNGDSFLGMDLTSDNHVSPRFDGESVDSLSGRSNFETVETDRLPDLHTLGVGYETFEEESGADLPPSYLREEAQRMLDEEEERSLGEQSEVVQRQAGAMKTSAKIAGLPGPFSRVLQWV